jgi:hypothetical protein
MVSSAGLVRAMAEGLMGGKVKRRRQVDNLISINAFRVVFILCGALLMACSASPRGADPASDAPEGSGRVVGKFIDAASYDQALQVWRTPEDINGWIGARFTYDMARAMALSETERNQSSSITIYEPAEFFAAPSGVCVDLSRFAVETLRQIDANLQPNYLMIEFAPI